jgi:hypothetical protein
LLDNGNGTSQFFIDNNTGATDGCSTPNGFPVCTILDLSGTLSYSYTSGNSTVTSTAVLASALGPDAQNPNGDEAYAPSNFAFNVSAASFTSASFSGSFTPVNFTADTGSYTSGGIVVRSADVIANGGFALLNTTASPATGSVPEPSSIALAMGGILIVPVWEG